MLFAWWLSVAALAVGAAFGVRAFFDPKWAQRFVRLKPDEQGGGFAEFRATYGGVIAAMHFAALALVLRYLLSGGHLVGVVATGAVAVIAAAWAGSAAGRAMAFWRDSVRTKFNLYSAGVEAALSLIIAGPWLLWLLAG